MSSPVVATSQEMDWPEAMRAVIDGKKVTRLEWGNEQEYLYLADGWLTIKKRDGSRHRLLTSTADMFALDWVIVFNN